MNRSKHHCPAYSDVSRPFGNGTQIDRPQGSTIPLHSSAGSEGRETLEPIYHDLPQCPPPAAHAASTLLSKSVDLFKYDRQRCCGDGAAVISRLRRMMTPRER